MRYLVAKQASAGIDVIIPLEGCVVLDLGKGETKIINSFGIYAVRVPFNQVLECLKNTTEGVFDGRGWANVPHRGREA